jgi:hypothetical protein
MGGEGSGCGRGAFEPRGSGWEQKKEARANRTSCVATTGSRGLSKLVVLCGMPSQQKKWQICNTFIIPSGKCVGSRLKLANGEVSFIRMTIS